MGDIDKKKLLRVDFHCHTNFSRDSLTKPEMLVKMCLRKGLDRIVVTDHNTIEGALIAHHLDPNHIIIGEEIMTTQGEILAVYVKENIPAGIHPLDAVQMLRNQGAFISISHPFDRMRNGSWSMNDILSILPHVDAIEGFNARTMTHDSNRKAIILAKEHDIAITAGSDAHAAFELGTATILVKPFKNAEELKINIKKGILAAKRSPWWVHIFSTYAKYSNNLKRG